MAEEIRIVRPARDKASSKLVRLIIVVLLLISAALTTIVLVGGWDKLVGMQVVQIAYVVIYLVMAFYVLRWNRGVLPLAAALAIILGIFAAIAGPEWFERDKAGFSGPSLDEEVLGLITLLIIPVQILLIAFSMSGFRQGWNVEVELGPDQRYDPATGEPAPA